METELIPLATKNIAHQLPDGWELSRLGMLVKFVNGYAFKPEDWKTTGLPIIRIQNLNDANASYNYYDAKVPERYYVRKGDLLFAWSGTKGVSFGARVWKGELAILNQHIFRVIPTKIDSDYCYYLLRGAQEAVEKNAHGFKSTFVHVTKGELEKVKVTIPPFAEQRKIVGILATWDEAIQTARNLLTVKQKRKWGLMQQLLTGQVRLSGFSEAWREVKIRNVAHEVSKRNKADKALKVLSCTKYNGLVDSLEYFGRKIYSDDLSTYKIAPKNCFAYATNHIEEGSIGYQSKYDEALISPMYTVFRTDKTVDDAFLYSVLKSERYVQIYQKNMTGSIDRRGGLRWEEFSNIKLSLPNLVEQQAIASMLIAADEEIRLASAEVDALSRQKRGLMQQLLTGQVRVNAD